MSTLVDYHGLQVVSPDPTGAGGLAIQNDFKDLVDWHPKSVWAESASPGSSDDVGDDFYPGSIWLRTDTSPPRLFVCRTNSASAAVWDEIAVQPSNYALLGGRASGQTLTGGTGSAENMTLASTAHGTKGHVYMGGTGFDFNETNRA